VQIVEHAEQWRRRRGPADRGGDSLEQREPRLIAIRGRDVATAPQLCERAVAVDAGQRVEQLPPRPVRWRAAGFPRAAPAGDEPELACARGGLDGQPRLADARLAYERDRARLSRGHGLESARDRRELRAPTEQTARHLRIMPNRSADRNM